MTHKKGFILLAVIAVLTAASAALVMASLSARLSAKGISVSVDLAQAKAASNAVLARAVLGLGEETSLYADGRPYEFAINEVQLTYWLIDTRGLIDLNGADEDLLSAFFAHLGQTTPDAAALAATIIDWRDEDDDPRTSGAEKRDYQNAGLPEPGNRAFVDVSELRGVFGMGATLYKAAAPYFFAGSGLKIPEALNAPIPVLDILPITPVQRSDILSRRQKAEQPLSLDTPSQTSGETPVEDNVDSPNTYLLLVEAKLPSGTKQAEQLVFSTRPHTGEYAILSRRTLPIGLAEQLYGPDSKNDPS